MTALNTTFAPAATYIADFKNEFSADKYIDYDVEQFLALGYGSKILRDYSNATLDYIVAAGAQLKDAAHGAKVAISSKKLDIEKLLLGKAVLDSTITDVKFLADHGNLYQITLANGLKLKVLADAIVPESFWDQKNAEEFGATDAYLENPLNPREYEYDVNSEYMDFDASKWLAAQLAA